MNNRVALIAYSVRFPGTDTQQFWGDLLAKKDLVTQVDPSRWSQDTFLHPDKRHPGTSYSFAAGSIGDVSGFDAAFFGISPREATLIDPQQRVLLELAWETLENAGIAPARLRGSDCGVYVGISNVDYAYRLADDMGAIEAAAATGIISSIASNRISYVFDLHGPSISMDTACSSSMVAFHQACQAIRSGEISQALAGGINLHLHPYGFVSFAKATMLSKTGRCHVFDESGDGYVRSEGGGLFYLKNYEQAVADGDPILALIAGSAVNTDGYKSGLTIPNPYAQSALMAGVYQRAGIDPNAIDYFEAHGTGTAVGDPIETHAIGLALGQKRRQPLLIGSVKSNLGHLESASGVAGLAKALNCLKYRAVPATISAQNLNTKIKFVDWNLRVVTDTVPLKAKGDLTIGINSFGFGGANAHVILQTPPTKIRKKTAKAAVPNSLLPLVLSAKDAVALQQSAQKLAALLDASTAAFYDVAYSAFFKRERQAFGLVVFADNATTASQQLNAFAEQPNPPEKNQAPTLGVFTGSHLTNATGLAFIYSGNGCQWQGMGKRLLEESPLFRQTVAQVDALFQNYADFSLLDELAGNNGDGRYQRTEIAQPALFAVQVGITEVLRGYGCQISAVMGHSVGEVAAAWACGALSLAEAVKVIYYRSHHQGKTLGSGGMTAVGLNIQSMQDMLTASGVDKVYLAGDNSHRGVTIAGDTDQLTYIESLLAANNTFFKRLDLAYAFHSPAMDAIETGIRADLAELLTSSPTIPFYSTVTGGLLSGDTRLDADYWWRNIREPVQFANATHALLESGVNIWVEVGAHTVLQSYLNDALKAAEQSGLVIPTLTRKNATAAQLLQTTAQILLAGSGITAERWFPVKGQFTALPNYPWQREKLWHPVTQESQGLLYRYKQHPLLGYALKQHALIWENQLDTQLQPFLADHNVGGAVVFPGAGFAELALAAAHLAHTSEFIEIEDLEIRAPLILSHDHSKTVRFVVDATDGRFHCQSRDFGKTSEWQQHSVGRILSEATGKQLAITAPVLPTRQPDFDQASHAALTRHVGLEYGPAFQAIQQGWVEGDTVIGVLGLPESISENVAEFYVHPSLLDCAFQLIFQILQDELHRHEDIAFVPVKMGKLYVRGNHAVPLIAQATLLHRGPHSLKAQFRLFDVQGQAIASLEDVRFRAVRLHKAHTQTLHYLDYHLTAAPLLGTDAPLAWSAPLIGQSIAANMTQAAVDRYSNEVEPLLDALSEQFVVENLYRLADATGLISCEQLAQRAKAFPQAEAMLGHLLAIASDKQLLAWYDNRGWQLNVERSSLDIPATAIWNTLIQDYPDYFYLVQWVGRVGMQWERLLSGVVDANNLGISPELYSAFCHHVFEHTSKTTLAKTVIEQISGILTNLATGQRLRILEIGAYSQPFAPLLCPHIDFNQADYCLASLCDHAFLQANNLREHYPLLRSIRLGDDAQANRAALEKPANLTIIHLNIANTNQIQQLLSQLSGWMVAGSPLWIIGQQPAHWVDTVLGLAPDWWLVDDAERMSPQLSADHISKQLQSLGFTEIDTLAFRPEAYSGNYLVTATYPATTRVKRELPRQTWLLLADTIEPEHRFAQSLAGCLQQSRQTVVIAKPEQNELSALISQGVDHIVHLSGFRQPLISQQTERCWLANAILRGCEQRVPEPKVWLITSQVGSMLACDQVSAFIDTFKSPQLANDAALWGFGRCLQNESGQSIHLLDINGDLNDAVVDAVVNEFLYGDAEQEVVLNSDGKRFATRLRSNDQLPSLPTASPETQDIEPTLRLSFKLPGQLRNLYWQAVPSLSPAADEIEIAVHATGLNFRDVMYTLGLLSDEAVENGFVGSTLGLEFAGRVTRVGAQVTAFKIGDKVVGLGSASFSNRVLTKPNAITHIPEGMSYAAAATIPSTFFTVYYALHYQARLQAGEKVLIHGAAGGVGIAAIQIAQWLGAEIYATVGADEKRDFLRLLGVEHIYDSRSLRFAEDILANTEGRGVDVVLNSLAGEAINRNFQVLKPFGRFLELGKRDFYENTHIGLRPFRNNISYFGIDADQLMQERPELTQKLFAEMMQLFHNGELHPLPYTTFDANQVVDAFRYMQQAKQIGKIVVTYEQGIHIKPSAAHNQRATPIDVHFNEAKCYFVTGGLSGFGLRSAQWLVAHGAKHLVLMGRSGASSTEAQIALAEFADQGVNVYAAAVDVTDKSALNALLSHCKKIMPPIAGIIHAAAVIDDSLARNMSEQQLQSVMAPKMAGAHNLHELTADLPLDFFVLYSSVTTLFGNPGQSNYVAANAWLEALAAYRRQLGLPATCIAWGAIDDVGFLARNEKIKEALQNRLGGAALASEMALAKLADILFANSPTVGVMAFDWRNLSSFLPSARSPKFRELALHAHGAEHTEDHDNDIQRLLAELPDLELRAAFIELLKEELAQILLVNKDKIDANQSMYDIGLDSLMGVELMIAIEARFRVQIPVMTLSEASSISKLADRLIAHLRGDKEATGNDTQASIEDLSKRHASAVTAEQLANLTEELENHGTHRIIT